MQAYLDLVQRILVDGKGKSDRTGTGTVSLRGSYQIEHNMAEGFPLITTKKMAKKSIKVELEGFIKGITDKKWYQDRGCKIWDEWCNPKKAPYGNDEKSKELMRAERDLGPIYGFQWRHFNADYKGIEEDYTGKGEDQLEKNIVSILKKDKSSRRMVVSAINPSYQNQMALFPCHDSFQVKVVDDKLDLTWRQRSVDTMLGLPFNIASYGLMLHLLAKEANLGEGILTGQLGDVHIYKNHFNEAREQLEREPYRLPKVETLEFDSIFNWTHDKTKFVGYKSHEAIKMPVAV